MKNINILRKRSRIINNQRPIIVCGLFVFVLLGIFLYAFYQSSSAHARSINYRDNRISDALYGHQVKAFLVDENRLQAGRFNLPSQIETIRVTDCIKTLQQGKEISPPYQKHSFAYLLTYNHISNREANCKLQQIINAFGRPNLSVTIIGSLENPGEQILFYDLGANKDSNKVTPKNQAGTAQSVVVSSLPASVMPIALDKLQKYTPCQNNLTINIVAHQDDDLLFLNPDLQSDITAKKCVTTVFLTAGDAGNNQFYWLGRELGAQAAYSQMTTEHDDLWLQRIVKLAENEYVTIATPKANPKISLIFMHLPDGYPTGVGYKVSKYQSLQKLASNKIPTIISVDGQSTYSSVQLYSALAKLMNYYNPSVIRSQSQMLSLKGKSSVDHSDHVSTGKFAKQAFEQYVNRASTPFYAYHGYPIYSLPPNLTDSQIAQKETTFLQYAAHDAGVCNSHAECVKSKDSYGSYLTRMYRASN